MSDQQGPPDHGRTAPGAELPPAPGPTPAPTPAEPVGEPGEPNELSRDAEWQRLDPRMLLVHPVKEVMRFVPVLIAVFVIGSTNGPALWQVAAVAVPVALGVLRYLTTTFRVAEGQVQLRRGLLERHLLAVPVDRVRTVDLSASLIHRLLGLTTIKVGTGTASSDSDEQLDLDALPTARAEELRQELLRIGAPAATGRRGDPHPDDHAGPSHPPGSPPPPPAPPVARFRLGWLRYAPLTGGGLAIAGATIGVATQLVSELRIDLEVPGLVTDEATWWLVLIGLLALLVAIVAFSVLAYAAAFWGLTLTHPGPGAPWHVRRGLFTTRETSIDEDRLAGVSLGEGVVLRWAGAAKLGAIVTGLRGDSTLVPPAPRAVADGAAAAILGDHQAVSGPLRGHGPMARRRRFTRALMPGAVLGLALLIGGLVADLPVDISWIAWLSPLPLLVAAVLAIDRARTLGHALVPSGAATGQGLLVARSGSVLCHRDVLRTEHVIGWNFRSSWFQRHAGLATTVATTAGGRQHVTVLDVPEDDGVELADRAVPGLVEQFLA